MKKLVLTVIVAVCMKPAFAGGQDVVSLVETPSLMQPKDVVSLVEIPSVTQPKDVVSPVETPGLTQPKEMASIIETLRVTRPKDMASIIETSRVTRPNGKRLWQFSIAALVVGNVMDAQSSWGKRELNQNLAGSNGSFGLHSVLLKAGITAGVCGVEYLVLHRRPSASLYRKLAFVNFGDASVTGAIAIRNYGIPRY